MLLLLVVYHLASSLLHNEIAIRDAVAVSRVSLEPDQAGSRINLVLNWFDELRAKVPR